MIEKKYIQDFVSRYWLIWVIALIVGLVVGFVGASQLKSKYEGTVAFSVLRDAPAAQANAPYYTYDGYYNAQTAILARNDLAAWLDATKTIHDVYDAAQVTLPHKAATSLSTLFKISDTGVANQINLTYGDASSDNTAKLGTAVVNYVKANYKPSVDGVHIVMSDPLVLPVDPQKNLIAVGVALGVTLLAFFVTLLTHYFRAEK